MNPERVLLFSVLSLLAFGTAALASLVLFYRWDSAANHGLQWGYWGDFNRTSSALASISGVKITEHWAHRDVFLEEFGFTLQMSGERVTLAFGESDPIRFMPRA